LGFVGRRCAHGPLHPSDDGVSRPQADGRQDHTDADHHDRTKAHHHDQAQGFKVLARRDTQGVDVSSRDTCRREGSGQENSSTWLTSSLRKPASAISAAAAGCRDCDADRYFTLFNTCRKAAERGDAASIAMECSGRDCIRSRRKADCIAIGEIRSLRRGIA
jgi:hypothetical protein